MMKERPILFAAPMVRALLDGSKMQTRQAIKLPPAPMTLGTWEPTTIGGQGATDARGAPVSEMAAIWHTRTGQALTNPLGQPGNHLWVREDWQAWHELNSIRAADIPNDARQRINYPANGNTWDARIRPSIQMPRWVSRILLEIVSVRVERLNGISEDDCWAEGIEAVDGLLDDMSIIDCAKRMNRCFEDAAPTFAALWESINGVGSWFANPWVWVIEFKRVAP